MGWNDIPLKIKLIFLFLILSIVPMLILGILAYNNASDALEEQAFNQLTSVREAKGRQIEAYFQQIHDQIITLSEDLMIADLSIELKEAFWNIDHGISDEEYEQMENSIRSYYQKEFLSRLNVNVERSKSIAEFWPDDRESIILQYYYISSNPNPTGKKHKLDDARDGSDYSIIHKTHHPIIRDYLEKFGYYDIFLADPDTGHIFYTVFKEVDYTTSLLTGPYSNTNFAAAFKKAAAAGKAGNKDYVAIEDFGPYDPSYHAPASFIASPVFSKEREFVAVLLFQMPVDNINSIMTGNEGWEDDGLGESGETYLVGPDYMMRSISRFYIQDKEGMFEALDTINYDKSLMDLMDKIGTTIGLMKVQTAASEDALSGIVDTKIINDYRGIPVLSSFRQLDIEGLDYVLLSEIDEAEAFKPVVSLRNSVIFIAISVAIIVSLIAFFIAKSIIRPINMTVAMLKDIAEGEGDLTKRLEVTNDEIGTMSSWFNRLIDNIESMILKIKKNVEKTASTSQELTASSEQVNASTEQVSSTVQSIAKGGQQLSKSASDTKKITDELILSIKTVTGSAQNSAMNANEVNNAAKHGGEAAKAAKLKMNSISESVNSSTKVVQELGEKSQQINKVIEVINSIAEQTNLLALNAAIEAARAGEAGKGFAVVADEVRKLAEESQKATKQIESMINEIVESTKRAVGSMETGSKEVAEGSKVVNEALASLDLVSQKIAGVAEQAELISASTQAQLASSEKVQKAISDVSSVAEESAASSEEVSASVEETTSSMQQITSAAQSLSASSDELITLVNKFKINERKQQDGS